MAYSPTTWINNTAPAINATNLNNIETGVDEVHDAVENITTGHDHDGTDSKKVTAADVINVAAGDIVATDVQTAVNELDTEKVAKATYDANTILAANIDNTPAAVTIAEQTLVGRITAGNIDDLSVAQVQTLINVEDGADVTDDMNVEAAGAVMEADFDPHTILAAVGDNTPTAVTISASRLIGRTAMSDIEDLTGAEGCVILGVEAGADVTDATNVAAAGAVMDADTTISLDTISESTGGVGVTIDGVLNKDYIIIESPSGDTAITAAGGITVTRKIMRVAGSGGAIDITADPQIVAGADGQFVIVQGTHDTNTVTLDNGTGLALSAQIILAANDNITLMYDSGETAWIETSRTTVT